MTKGKRLCILLIGFCFLIVGCGKTGQAGSNTQQNEVTQNTEYEETQTEEDIELGTQMKSETEVETEAEPIVTTLTLSAAGDCTLGVTQQHGYENSFHEYYDNYGETYFFENFKEIFEKDDLTLVNLECVLTDSNNRVEKTFNLKGKPKYVGIMTSGSIEAVSLGNNHTRDYGEESLVDTQETLDQAGILYAYNDKVSYFTSDEGIVVAMVSSSVLGSTKSHETYLLEGVEEAVLADADIIVACCHWGIERDYYPTEYQQELGHKLIDAGADLVIGHHPHVLQGIEEYNGKIICYSLGNFCFGGNRNPAEKNTIVYQQTFTFVDGILQSEIDAGIIPSRISGHSGYNDFQPMIATGEQAESIINKMNQYSAPYSSVTFDASGKLVINTSKQ